MENLLGLTIESDNVNAGRKLRQEVLGWSDTDLDVETVTNIRHVAVRDESGEVVGCGSCALVAFPDGLGGSFGPVRAMRFWGVAVSPEYEGQGIGTRIMEAITERARQQGVRLLWGNVRTTATSFYEQIGYRAVGNVADSMLSGLPSQKMVFDFFVR